MTGRSLEEWADDQAEARFVENEGIARKNRVLRSHLKETRSERDSALLEVDNLTSELALFRREYESDGPEWLAEDHEGEENHGTLVPFLSDSHVGEMVNPAEVAGYNAFDLDIADARLGRFFERTVRIAREFMAGVIYDGVVLPFGGDLVSGDIHDELVETNEQSTYESVAWLLPRLETGVRLFVEEFGRVHVVSAPGNHPRDSKLPRYKKRSAHNADTLIAHLLAERFKGDERVTFSIPKSIDVTFKIYDWQFSMEHGDELQKGFSGSAEIGALGPAKRGTNRKKTQYQAEGKTFDYNLLGHFHQYVPAASQGFIMNGSLKGMDEYARGLHLKPEPAQQALMLCTPEHGITAQLPIFVADQAAEGW